MWAKIEQAAGDDGRAKELIRASVELTGKDAPAALAIHAAAKFLERSGGSSRAARKLYERVLSVNPSHAPSLQVGPPHAQALRTHLGESVIVIKAGN